MIAPYYQQDGITIYHGDCRELLPTLGKLQVVLTDPPWETSERGIDINIPGVAPIRYGSHTVRRGDVGYFDIEVIKMIVSQCEGDCFILAGYKELADICKAADPLRGVFVWHKANAPPPRFYPAKMDCSFIVWTAKNSQLYGWQRWPSMIFSVPKPSTGCMSSERYVDGTGHAIHPCQGPLSLYLQLLRPLPRESIVVDPYMGTGTTLRAAKDLGGQAVGIEIEERYCEIAAKRMEQRVFDFEPAVSNQASA
jgi:site-specific DNA-methyltransferase (adenine-specific)